MSTRSIIHAASCGANPLLSSDAGGMPASCRSNPFRFATERSFNMNRFFSLLVFFFFVATSACAEDGAENAVRARIAERFPGVTIDDVVPSPIPGLYEVMVGPMVIYSSADGRYVIKGDIYDLETDRNLTESRLALARAKALEALDDEDLIVFGDRNAKYDITVFTDVGCTYCRRMHSQIEEYNALGIRIRYAAFPRNGLASREWRIMVDVWCAPDRQQALTLAKLDKPFETKSCQEDHVTEQWQLGRMLGVSGTPAIFTSAGAMVPGYLPPQQLLKQLKSLQAAD